MRTWLAQCNGACHFGSVDLIIDKDLPLKHELNVLVEVYPFADKLWCCAVCTVLRNAFEALKNDNDASSNEPNPLRKPVRPLRVIKREIEGCW